MSDSFSPQYEVGRESDTGSGVLVSENYLGWLTDTGRFIRRGQSASEPEYGQSFPLIRDEHVSPSRVSDCPNSETSYVVQRDIFTARERALARDTIARRSIPDVTLGVIEGTSVTTSDEILAEIIGQLQPDERADGYPPDYVSEGMRSYSASRDQWEVAERYASHLRGYAGHSEYVYEYDYESDSLVERLAVIPDSSEPDTLTVTYADGTRQVRHVSEYAPDRASTRRTSRVETTAPVQPEVVRYGLQSDTSLV